METFGQGAGRGAEDVLMESENGDVEYVDLTGGSIRWESCETQAHNVEPESKLPSFDPPEYKGLRSW